MLKAKDIMTKGLHVIPPEASLQTAAQTMREKNVGMLPVVSDEGMALGTITDRDIAVRGVAEGLTPKEGRVNAAMTSDVTFCYDDDSVEDVAKVMKEKMLRRVVVVAREDKRVKGLVSLGDLGAKCDDHKLAGSVMAEIAGHD